jgi:hypothetical protein
MRKYCIPKLVTSLGAKPTPHAVGRNTTWNTSDWKRIGTHSERVIVRGFANILDVFLNSA